MGVVCGEGLTRKMWEVISAGPLLPVCRARTKAAHVDCAYRSEITCSHPAPRARARPARVRRSARAHTHTHTCAAGWDGAGARLWPGFPAGSAVHITVSLPRGGGGTLSPPEADSGPALFAEWGRKRRDDREAGGGRTEKGERREFGTREARRRRGAGPELDGASGRYCPLLITKR